MSTVTYVVNGLAPGVDYNVSDGSLNIISTGNLSAAGSTAVTTITGPLYIGGSPASTNAYILLNGTLNVTGDTYIGYNGAGTFNQGGVVSDGNGGWITTDGGIHNTTNLYLGGAPDGTSGTGVYNPNTGTLNVTGNTYVGYNDPVGSTFNQWGGTHNTTNLYIGGGLSPDGTNTGSGTGTYNLNNGTLSVTGNTYVGYNDPSASGSTFSQYGGSYGTQTLYIGGNPDGTSGTSGTGTYTIVMGSLAANTAYVGYNGTGTFNQGYDPITGQTGDGSNTVTIANNLYIGGGLSPDGTSYGSGTGTYNLYNGSLSVGGTTYVGYNGTGTFNQTGGTHQTSNLYVGGSPDGTSGTGIYNLSGNGSLNVTGTTYVGYNGGIGTFNQSGSTHAAGSIIVGGTGTYNYSGGTITGALQNYGRVNMTGGAVGTPNTFGASVSNYAAFNVNQANVVFANAVTNNAGGIFTVNGSNVTFQGTFLNYGNLVSDPSTIIFKGIFTGGGTITASSGDTYEFVGAGDNTINLGPGGLTITNLILGPGVTLTLTGGGSLTVTTLTDPTGTDSGITGNFSAANYGKFSAVPIPGAIVLLGPGLLALVGLRRRLKG